MASICWDSTKCVGLATWGSSSADVVQSASWSLVKIIYQGHWHLKALAKIIYQAHSHAKNLARLVPPATPKYGRSRQPANAVYSRCRGEV